jgi:hypothetical protein
MYVDRRFYFADRPDNAGFLTRPRRDGALRADPESVCARRDSLATE